MRELIQLDDKYRVVIHDQGTDVLLERYEMFWLCPNAKKAWISAAYKIQRLEEALDKIVAESHSWVMEQETAAIKKPIYDKFREIAKKALERE